MKNAKELFRQAALKDWQTRRDNAAVMAQIGVLSRLAASGGARGRRARAKLGRLYQFLADARK